MSTYSFAFFMALKYRKGTFMELKGEYFSKIEQGRCFDSDGKKTK